MFFINNNYIYLWPFLCFMSLHILSCSVFEWNILIRKIWDRNIIVSRQIYTEKTEKLKRRKKFIQKKTKNCIQNHYSFQLYVILYKTRLNYSSNISWQLKQFGTKNFMYWAEQNEMLYATYKVCIYTMIISFTIMTYFWLMYIFFII